MKVAMSKIKEYCALILVLVSQVNSSDFCDVSLGNDTLQKIVAHPSENITIEFIVFCDYEFGKFFSFNREKIVNYFRALFTDVQLKYETFESPKIFFRVNEIIVFENAEQQPFIEAVRFDNGTVSVKDVIKTFEDWLYANASAMHYDIGISAIGANLHGDDVGAVSLDGSACSFNSESKKIMSSVVIGVNNTDPGLALAHVIAHILGASHDDEDKYNCHDYDATENQQYIMGRPGNWFGTNAYYFSKCSKGRIVKFLQSVMALCLTKFSKNNRPVISTEELSTTSVGMKEQCQFLLGDPSAYFYPIDPLPLCSAIVCTSNSSPGSAPMYRPLEGSPCDIGKRCFRGRCVSPGIRLVSVKTGRCLGSQNHFNHMDNGVMHDCSATHMFFQLNIHKSLSNDFVLWTEYNTKEGNSTALKCLKLSKENDNGQSVLKFKKCCQSTSLRWEIMWLEDSDEFLLRHKNTQKCLSGEFSLGKVYGESSCLARKISLKWKLQSENGMVINQHNFGKFIQNPEAGNEDEQEYSLVNQHFDSFGNFIQNSNTVKDDKPDICTSPRVQNYDPNLCH